MNPTASVSTPSTFTPSVFLALSSGLTGMSPGELRPGSPESDVVALFHSTVHESLSPGILARLGQTFLSASTVAEGAAEVLIDPELGPVGRSIIRLWLTGLWHHPAAPSEPPRPICNQAYRQSPVWRSLQAHALQNHLLSVDR